ncbi:hypothetical protein RBA71_02080 [Brenneria goodwinii]|uniref:hypothetical protein n=1 Tax=Brenneria goodwinii TaxID=1109412 RepID=UPI0036E64537
MASKRLSGNFETMEVIRLRVELVPVRAVQLQAVTVNNPNCHINHNGSYEGCFTDSYRMNKMQVFKPNQLIYKNLYRDGAIIGTIPEHYHIDSIN